MKYLTIISQMKASSVLIVMDYTIVYQMLFIQKS